MEKLMDDELDNVAGGFMEKSAINTLGMDIQCPTCHAKSSSSFSGSVLQDPKTGSVEYHCNNCGTDFVCYEGNVILKSKWIALCKKKGHSYPFA